MFFLIMNFFNAIVAMLLMAFGVHDQKMCGWILMIIVMIQTSYWAIGDSGNMQSSNGYLVMIGAALIASIVMALISSWIWTMIYSGVFLLQFTLLSISHFGGSIWPNSIGRLDALSVVCVPLLIAAEILLNAVVQRMRTSRR